MNLYGKSVMLRAIETEDLDRLQEMMNSPDLEHLVVGWSRPISARDQREWYERQQADRENLRFVIDRIRDGGPAQCLGLAELTGIDWKNRKAGIGLKIGDVSDRRRGYGRDTVMTLMRYAFHEMNLHRLEASWLEDNPATGKLAGLCGMRIEGKRRGVIYKDGRYHDSFCGGILAEDFRKVEEETGYWNV